MVLCGIHDSSPSCCRWSEGGCPEVPIHKSGKAVNHSENITSDHPKRTNRKSLHFRNMQAARGGGVKTPVDTRIKICPSMLAFKISGFVPLFSHLRRLLWKFAGCQQNHTCIEGNIMEYIIWIPLDMFNSIRTNESQRKAPAIPMSTPAQHALGHFPPLFASLSSSCGSSFQGAPERLGLFGDRGVVLSTF